MCETQVPDSDKFLLVTPVWNDASRLAGFGMELAEALAASGHQIDWVIADDGSGPEEHHALEKLLEKLTVVYPHIALHFAAEHHGKGSVVREAWSLHPDAKWLSFVDADGSLPAAEMVRMIEVARQGGQSVLGIRKRTETTHVDLSVPRFIAHKLFILAVRILVGLKCTDPQCGAKILLGSDYRLVADSLVEVGLAFDAELLTALSDQGLKWTELPVTWIEKDGGKVRPMRDAWGMLAALWRIRGRRK